MRSIITLLLAFIPLCNIAQGNKGEVENCAPMINGKVCYIEEVDFQNVSKDELYAAIYQWANKEYGRDYFLSNVVGNKSRASILISSKYELLLREDDKTIIKFKMRITCADNKYIAEVSDITFQYDPNNEKRYKTYKAEDVLTDNGKGNKISIIQEPELFCNATYFFVENLFGDVFEAAKNAD